MDRPYLMRGQQQGLYNTSDVATVKENVKLDDQKQLGEGR